MQSFGKHTEHVDSPGFSKLKLNLTKHDNIFLPEAAGCHKPSMTTRRLWSGIVS
jgi:hypothetical protein